jgi:phenylacetaldehyde dehydrogenase
LDAAKGNLKKVSLELGGKSANIIFADADIEAAVAGSAGGVFFNAGQSCAAGSRLYVHEDVYDDVVSGFAAAAEQIKVGDGFDPTSEMGPMVSSEHFDRVSGYLRKGFEEGGRAVTGGDRVGDTGYFVAPTLFADVNPDHTIVREEVFGPVVVAMKFRDEDEVIAAANSSRYGLAGGVWTRDVSTAHRVSAAFRSGTVWINCYQVFDPAMPFGGYKESGWGREMGHEVLHDFTELKTVCINIAN